MERRIEAQRLLRRVAEGGAPLSDTEIELVLSASHRDESDVDVVMLPAVVVDKQGAPVTGLTRDDFELYDEGQEQLIAWFGEDDERPFRLLLLLDVSGSMDEPGMTASIRGGLLPLMRQVRHQDRIKLVAFAGKVVKEMTDWNSMPMTTLDRALRLPRGGRTALADALARAATIVPRNPKERQAIILVSDGMDTSSTLSPEAAIAAARDVEVPIYVFALGGEARLIQDERSGEDSPFAVLRRIAAETGGRFFLIGGRDEAELAKTASNTLKQDLRHQYLISFRPASPPDGAFHRIELRVRQPGLAVRSRLGYRRGTPARLAH